MKRIVIFANGNVPDLEKARAILHSDDFILCADGGTRHALALGIKPDLVLGDMDSIDRDQLQSLQEASVEIELFPRDKNETDLELAIARAIEFQPDEIVLVGALGGRLDHTLSNLALLSDPRLASRALRLDDGVEACFFCRDRASVEGRSGDLVSLIPWGAPVQGIQTDGLKWPLRKETLFPEKTRGISNELTQESATIQFESGLLLVVHIRRS